MTRLTPMEKLASEQLKKSLPENSGWFRYPRDEHGGAWKGNTWARARLFEALRPYCNIGAIQTLYRDDGTSFLFPSPHARYALADKDSSLMHLLFPHIFEEGEEMLYPLCSSSDSTSLNPLVPNDQLLNRRLGPENILPGANAIIDLTLLDQDRVTQRGDKVSYKFEQPFMLDSPDRVKATVATVWIKRGEKIGPGEWITQIEITKNSEEGGQ